MSDTEADLAAIIGEPLDPNGHDLHPILTNKQFEDARRRARESVMADKIAAAAKDVEDREKIRLRMEDGLTTGIGHQDEIVDILIDLPSYATHILLNGPMGKAYWHGTTVRVARHIADTLNEIMGNMWRHEDQTEGRSIAQAYMRKRDTSISKVGAVKNAPLPPGRVVRPGQALVQ